MAVATPLRRLPLYAHLLLTATYQPTLSSYMKGIYAILLAMLTATAYAQTETSSVRLEGDSIAIENSISTYSNISGGLFSLPTLSAPRFPQSFTNLNYRKSYKDLTVQIPSFSFMPGQSNLYSWRNGSIKATGAQTDMPGLMHIDNGAIGIFQSYESINLYLGVEANKYGFY